MVHILNTSATISRGDKGPGVQGLQKALNALGHDAGAPDGVFGAGTKKALSAFQANAGLGDDGIAGKRTWRALVEALKADDEGNRAALAESVGIAQQELMSWLASGAGLVGDSAALEQWMAQGNDLMMQSFGQLEQAGAAVA